MGWSSGSRLFSDLIEAVQEVDIDDDKKKTLYTLMIDAFENYDCDTLNECVGEDEVFDAVWNELYPDDSGDEFYDELEDE